MYKATTSCGEVGLILHEIYNKFLGYKKDGIFVEVVQMTVKLVHLHIIWQA